jgi:hypothetical protein
MVEAALDLIERYGWKIFPARMENGKKFSWMCAEHAPGHENWGMSNDPEWVRKNFSRARWRDKCGIGIPTGAVNGIFVVEADTVKGHGVDGLASLRRMQGEHDVLPKTLMAVSPSGSRHHYFQGPGGGVQIKSGNHIGGYEGVDCKGENSMVVGPPSQRADGAYRWLNKHPIAVAPKWLVEMVTRDERRGGPKNFFEQFGEEQHSLPTMAEVKAATAMIPNTKKTSRDEWVRVGFAIYAASDGEAFEVFDAWSRNYPEYDEEDTRTFWDTCKPPSSITAGTLFYLAEQAVPDWRHRLREPELRAKLAEFLELMRQA